MAESHRTGAALAACLLACLGVSPLVHAQWVTFADETALRLPTGPGLNDPATSISDSAQRCYVWGDFDHDGDMDLICLRKEHFSMPGGKTSVLFMNEGVAEGHAVNGVLIDRTAQYASASDAPDWNGQPDQGFLTPTNTVRGALVDVDNDGWEDLVTCACLSDNKPDWIGHPRVYMNLGRVDGAWQGFKYESGRIPFLGSPSFPAAQPRFLCVAAGDVTGDGYADLYFSDMDTGEVGPPEIGIDYNNKLLINLGRANPGVFIDSGTTLMSANPGLKSAAGVACAIADMNGDGAMDVVKDTCLNNPLHLAVQHNDPTNIGHFPDAVYKVVLNGAPSCMSLGDLNNDGRPDIVETDDGADKYLLNAGNAANGTVTFNSHPFTYQAGAGSDSGFGGDSHAADLDNDGWSDVIITDMDFDTFSCSRKSHIFHNLGDAPEVTMQEQIPLVIPTNQFRGVDDVAVLDIDGDGWLDLVVARCTNEMATTGTATVWRNTTPIPGDVDTNHRIDIDDLFAVVNAWGPCPSSPCPADLTHDGVIDVDDLFEVINHWTM